MFESRWKWFYVRLLHAVLDHVRLFMCSISERSIVFDWQNVLVSSITEPNRSQSKDWSSIGFDYRTFDWLRRKYFNVSDCSTLFSTCQAIKGLFYRDQFRLGFKWEISVRFPRWEQAKYPRDDFWREMRKSKHVEAQKSVITFAPVSFGNSYSCITAVKWDAYDVGNTAGKARRSGRSELIPLCRLLRSKMDKPRSREPIQPALSNEHIEDFTKDLEIRRDLGNRAHLKRP